MAKKTFIDNENPALQFISTVTKEDPSEKPAEGPESVKINPIYVETKSRRLQLVLQPSLFDRVKDKAKADGVSVNEYIHQLLDEATREEQQ